MDSVTLERVHRLWSRRRTAEHIAAKAIANAARPKTKRVRRPGGWRDWALANGRCADCGQPRGDTGTTRLCRTCAELRVAHSLDRVVVRKGDGLCIQCLQPRGEDGTSYHCRPCADKRKVWNKARAERLLAAGLCRTCGKPVESERRGKTRCYPCYCASRA